MHSFRARINQKHRTFDNNIGDESTSHGLTGYDLLNSISRQVGRSDHDGTCKFDVNTMFALWRQT
jgi:hypothetical protein